MERYIFSNTYSAKRRYYLAILLFIVVWKVICSYKKGRKHRIGITPSLDSQWRLTRLCQISLHCSCPAQCPEALYCLRYSQKNATMCSSVTACPIRHRIVSFKQQVRPIVLKMNPTKSIFWDSFYRILGRHGIYRSMAVEELCTLLKALPQDTVEI